VSIDFNNNGAAGGETVQMFARPSSGVWAAVRSFAVAGSAQHIEWDTALPLTTYEIAMRYLNGIVPGVGYEGYDPDAWTAPTAAGAKSTVVTSTAAVTGLAGVFLNSGAPLALSWVSAQQNVPYLLEKDVGAGFVTVASDIIGQAYNYTMLPAEIGTTVAFRVTAKRGALVGPSVTANVLLALVVGATAITSSSFEEMTGVATLTWAPATMATGYQLQKSTNGGATWTLVASPAGLVYAYAIAPAEANTTVKFRVRGTNGAVVGAYSDVVDVVLTVALIAPVLDAPVWNLGRYQLRYYGAVALAWSASGPADYYKVERNVDGTGWVTCALISGALAYDDPTDSSSNPPYDLPDSLNVNKSVSYRITPHNPFLGFGAASNVEAVTLTYAEDETITAVAVDRSDPYFRALQVDFGPDATGTLIWATPGANVEQGLILGSYPITSGVFVQVPNLGNIPSLYPVIVAIAKNGTVDYGNPSRPVQVTI
jgi:hypothetical protein